MQSGDWRLRFGAKGVVSPVGSSVFSISHRDVANEVDEGVRVGRELKDAIQYLSST